LNFDGHQEALGLAFNGDGKDGSIVPIAMSMTIAFAQYNLNLVSVLPSLNQNKIEDCALGVLCLVYSSICSIGRLI